VGWPFRLQRCELGRGEAKKLREARRFARVMGQGGEGSLVVVVGGVADMPCSCCAAGEGSAVSAACCFGHW
jgi:hypothetical protein